jgi:hypothetical protein
MWLASNWEGSEVGPGVEQWHAELPDHVRRLINHPATVHRRYDKDWPKAKAQDAKPDLFAPDEDDEDEDGEEGEHEDGAEGFPLSEAGEPGADYTRESWLAEIGVIWEQGEAAWRDEFLDARVVERDAMPTPIAAAFDEAEAEIEAAVAREAALEVNAAARETDRVRLSGEPSSETVAVAVHKAAEEIRAVEAGEKAAPPIDFPDDGLRETAAVMSKDDFNQRLAVEEARLGKDAVAAVKKAHRYGRYRMDWPPILKALAALP